MNKTIKIEKEILFFYYEDINSSIVDELIEFVKSVPAVTNPKFINGTNILLDNITTHLNSDAKPIAFTIGFNNGGTIINVEILPYKYYFFNRNEICSVTDPKDIILYF